MKAAILPFLFAPIALASPLSTLPVFDHARPSGLLAPLHAAPKAAIENSYMVVFHDDVPASALLSHYSFLEDTHGADPLQDQDGGLRHVYDIGFQGYAGRFTADTIDKIRAQPEVAYVEQDQMVYATEIQKGAPWGLARVSHTDRLTFRTFNKYVYDEHGGEGVTVFVVDTGINIKHVEFEGRARWGKTIPQNDVDEDGNGHGTHCAGTIASRKYGVAKAAEVVAVKVLGSNGSGSMSDVVSGVQWAAKEAKSLDDAALAELRATGRTKHKGSVANMSLGGGKSPSLDRAVNNAVDGGLHFAVAAGNDNKDACNYSPAAAEKAVTVGASTVQDTPAYFSNHGPCVDVFAPGLNIKSTWTGSTTAENTISGTSMASPHVAGLLAYYLSIHGSSTFNPTIKDEMAPGTADFSKYYISIFKVVQRSLPTWITGFLPSLPETVVELTTAPIPSLPKLSPQQLKDALLEISSQNKLTGLPAKTVNKLIFNNATAAFGLL